jgi:gliding motility-associated-like protein
LLLEPDLDGEWNDSNGEAVADIIDADELGEEVYTYSIDREPCEVVSEDVTINVVEGPTTGDAVTDNNEFCPGDPDIQLRNYLTGEDEGGAWTNADGDTITDIFSPDEAGVYEFTYALASPECGLISTTVTITVNEAFCPEEPPMFNIPEGFSPNGDGINDEWVIEGLNILYPNNQLQIFNRWGAEVLNASPYDNDWDGRSDGSGEQLPVGTYWYILDLGDDSEPMKGFIYLNR